MATNQDFNNLITRINKATDTLELNVGVIAETGVEVGEQLTLAQTAAANAKKESENATVQANTSSVKATVSTTQATKAEQQAQVATQAKTDALAAVEQAKELAPFQEAPKNGSVYGRKDGTWALVESSGSGGGGSVVSVNGVLPDLQGDVKLSIPEQVPSDWNAVEGKGVILNKPKIFSGAYVDLEGKPTLFSGDYNDLQNKPTLFNGSYNSLTSKPVIPTNNNQLANGAGYLTEAPKDGEQYARKSGTWVKVEAGESSGGEDVGFPMPFQNLYYSSKVMTNWASTNPNDAIDLSKLGAYVDGEYYTGADFFNNENGIDELVTGRYFFKQAMLPSPLSNSYGYIDVVRVPTGGGLGQDEVTATAYVLNTNSEIKDIYVYNTKTRAWSLQTVIPTPVPEPTVKPATSVVNKRTSTPFETWIGTQAQYDLVTPKDPNTLYWITEV